MAVCTSLTLSFGFDSPVLQQGLGFRFISCQFLLKDIVLLGSSLVIGRSLPANGLRNGQRL